jgi:hypothetical protein
MFAGFYKSKMVCNFCLSNRLPPEGRCGSRQLALAASTNSGSVSTDRARRASENVGYRELQKAAA